MTVESSELSRKQVKIIYFSQEEKEDLYGLINDSIHIYFTSVLHYVLVYHDLLSG